MTVRVYRSTDAGAPSIGRSLGSLITLFDACLVDGYGAKASLGWTREFSATNTVVYRMAEGTRMYMRLQDDQHVDYISGTKWYFGFGATGVDTVLDQWTPQTSLYINKPDTTANGGAWMLVGDGSRFWLFTTRDGWGGAYSSVFFGDLISCAASPSTDRGKAMVMAPVSAPTAQTPPGSGYEYAPGGGTEFGVLPGHYLVGDLAGLCVAPYGIQVGKCTSLPFLRGLLPYPSTISGGVACSPFYVGTVLNKLSTGTDLRGLVPGWYAPYAAGALFTPPDGTQFTYSQGQMAGKTLEVIRVYMNQSNTYQTMLIEVSDTWGS